MATALRRAIDNSKKARRQRAFVPYQAPLRPPANTYDPGLDATQQAADRGYQDLRADTAQGLERGSNDYLLATGERQYSTGNQLADIQQGVDRTQADYAAGNVDRAHAFAVQAARQRDAANAAGVLGTSGWDAQAAQVRGGNQARDQAAADTALGRAQADYGTSRSRTEHAGGVAQGQLDLGWGRQTQDAQTALGRAGRENTIFATDTAAARLWQAQASGLWDPPVQPANEHRVNGTGRYFHRVPGGVILQGGRALTRAQFAAFKRRHPRG